MQFIMGFLILEKQRINKTSIIQTTVVVYYLLNSIIFILNVFVNNKLTVLYYINIGVYIHIFKSKLLDVNYFGQVLHSRNRMS